MPATEGADSGSWLIAAASAIVVIGLIVAGLIYFVFWNQFVPIAAMGINYARYMNAPSGTIATEVNAAWKAAGAPAAASISPAPSEGDWPSYNKTLTSNRFSQLNQINSKNADKLKVLCTYDTGQYTGFNSGLARGERRADLRRPNTTSSRSIRPPATRTGGRMKTTRRPRRKASTAAPPIWTACCFAERRTAACWPTTSRPASACGQTKSPTPKKGESAPAAPIAWNGLVFIGNAGGDVKGVKGRMYALDAKTGKIVWEFYLVPKTEGDHTRGPEAPSPARQLHLEQRSQAFRSPAARPGHRTLSTRTPGLLYVPGGNPAPDFATGERQGENLYSGSVVVLDAKTGAYKQPFQDRSEGLA